MKSFFDISDEKITEKAFLQGVVISILSIVLCIVGLCSMTYAWFTTDLSSSENIIESSSFSLDIYVTDENGQTIILSVNPNGTFTHLFDPGEYNVVLKITDDTTASKGYCDITVDFTQKEQTSPISMDKSIGVHPFEFTIVIHGDSEVITFEPKWGISASPDISNGDTWVLGLESDNVLDSDIENVEADDQSNDIN